MKPKQSTLNIEANKRAKALFFALLFPLFALRCSDTTTDDPPKLGSNTVLILNEGAFNQGNATISTYNVADKTVQNDVYFKVNDGKLGDVAQSMQVINDELYIVVNNSGKIIIADKDKLKQRKEVRNLPSPRYIVPINSTQAYISNLVLNNGTTAITKIDLNTQQVVGSIPTQFAEELVQVAADRNAVWTGIINTNWLLRIDTNTDSVTDTIRLTDSPKHLFVAQNGQSIWVICEGRYTGGTPSICRVNAVTKQIELTLNLPYGTNTVGACAYSEAYRCFYYVFQNKVWKMNTSDTQLPNTPFLSSAGVFPYALGVSATGDVYVGDAIDFSQKGRVSIYSPTGSLQHSFEVGVAPNSFLFP